MEKLNKLKFSNLPQLTDDEMKLVAGGCGSGFTGTVVCASEDSSNAKCYRGSYSLSPYPHCNCAIAFRHCGSI